MGGVGEERSGKELAEFYPKDADGSTPIAYFMGENNYL
jgi:hypothetical protein